MKVSQILIFIFIKKNYENNIAIICGKETSIKIVVRDEHNLLSNKKTLIHLEKITILKAGFMSKLKRENEI